MREAYAAGPARGGRGGRSRWKGAASVAIVLAQVDLEGIERELGLSCDKQKFAAAAAAICYCQRPLRVVVAAFGAFAPFGSEGNNSFAA